MKSLLSKSVLQFSMMGLLILSLAPFAFANKASKGHDSHDMGKANGAAKMNQDKTNQPSDSDAATGQPSPSDKVDTESMPEPESMPMEEPYMPESEPDVDLPPQ